MRQKLPMSLIHEGVGEVVYDPKGEFKKGDTVVMIPNTPTEDSDIVAENYLKSSKFRASGFDGFMQDYVFMGRDRIVKYTNINHEVASFIELLSVSNTPTEDSDIVAENYLKSSKFRASGFDGFMQDYVFMGRDRIVKYTNINHEVASFIELLSVSMHSIDRFDRKSHAKRDIIGVWGDGNVGFITSLILKKKYPESKIVVFGKNEEKLGFFSFVDEVYQIDNIPKDFRVDHAFEAVGGKASQYAIDQIGKNEEKLGFFSFVDEVYQIDNIPKDFRVDHAFEAVGGKASQYAIDQIIDHLSPEGIFLICR